MQSKGAIKFVAILLALACIWQLSFTLVTDIQENKAAKYAQNAVEAFKQSAAFPTSLRWTKPFISILSLR